MTPREIRTVSDLTRAIDELLQTSGRRWWFRGETTFGWDLLPRVRRAHTPEQERFMVYEFFGRARLRYHNCPSDEDTGAWIALMQHYGLPTRLLDWSSSPAIAAYFATEKARRNNEPGGRAAPYDDACIWALDPVRLNEQQGFEPLLYPLNSKKLERLLTPAWKDEPELNKVAAARPLESDMRMLMQQGVFTIHATDTPLNCLEGADEWLRLFRVPGAAVAPLAHELNLLGFRLGDLFPDLGNLAREITGGF